MCDSEIIPQNMLKHKHTHTYTLRHFELKKNDVGKMVLNEQHSITEIYKYIFKIK